MTAGPIEYVLAGKEMSLRVDRDHPDYEAFHAGMLAQVEASPEAVLDLRTEIAELCAPYQAFDVLFAVWMSYNVVYGETLRPLVQGPTRVPEYVAHVLLDRPNPLPTRAPNEQEQINIVDPKKLGDLVVKILQWLPLWFDFRQAGDTEDRDPWLELRTRFFMHRLLLTSFTYEWQERQTLRELFGPFDDELRKAIGMTVDEAIGLSEALARLPRKRASIRGKNARVQAKELLVEAAACRRGDHAADHPFMKRLADMPEADAEQWMNSIAMGWMSIGLGSAASFTPVDLATEAEVSVEAATSFLDAFSVDFGDRADRRFWEKDPRRAIGSEMETMRAHPILHDGRGRYLPCATDTVFFGIRDVLSEALKTDTGTWTRFDRERARLLERRAVAALASGLEADWSQTGVKFRFIDENGNEQEGEADGVVRAGTILVLVECKAGSLAPSARRAAPDRLERGLKDLIGKAHEQLSRSHRALVEGAATEIRDSAGTPLTLDLGQISRTLTIAVSLEELSPLAPAIWQLQAAGLLPEEEQIPWALGIHELELICELATGPGQLVHYVLRRLRAIRQRIWAMDEMDFFLKYLDDGLYFDDEQLDGVQAEIHSYTDRLDEYLYGEQGLRPKTKLPKQKIDSKTRELLRQLGELPSPARIEAQVMILEMDEKGRRRISSGLRQMANRTARDGEPHDLSLIFEGDFGVSIHSVPPELQNTLPARLHSHGYGRSEKSDLRRWLGLGVLSGKGGKVVAMAVLVDPREVGNY